jgi:hypothetical protein
MTAESQRLTDFTTDNFLKQWVLKPTRADNILDLVFTTEDNIIQNLEIRDSISNSDHKTVFFELITNIKTYKKKQFNTLNFKKANYKLLIEKLSTIDIKNINCANLAWDTFKSEFFKAKNEYIPTKVIKPNAPLPPWMSKNVIRAIKNRNTAYKLLKHSDVQRNRDKYNNTKREVKKLIRIERRNQEIQTSRDAKCNAKKFFSYVNSRKPIKTALNDIKMPNGNLSTSDYEKATVLNDYFKSVFAGADNSNTNIRTITTANARETPLNEIEITENDILRFIDKMNKFKSPGPDNFVPQVIKEVKHAIVSNLQHIFKLSINNCEIPNDWKQANIVPIYKKGNKTLPENYRPISLTSIICKILESIISEKITAYVDTNNLITKNQHGFRRKRSCTTNLLDFYGKVLKDFDTAKGVDLIYLDFQKAFDKVQHDLLV